MGTPTMAVMRELADLSAQGCTKAQRQATMKSSAAAEGQSGSGYKVRFE